MTLVSNLQVVMDFVKEIEAATGRKLISIDIGGGLSSTYKDSEEPEAFAYRKYRHIFLFKKNIWRKENVLTVSRSSMYFEK